MVFWGQFSGGGGDDFLFRQNICMTFGAVASQNATLHWLRESNMLRQDIFHFGLELYVKYTLSETDSKYYP